MMPTDEYIDRILDATTGYAEHTLETLLDERDMLIAAADAFNSLRRNQ